MKHTYYDSENLAQARALHDEAIRLHLAPPPIVTWEAKIFDPSGEQVEEILAKSNSYTRNALNAIACQATWVARYWFNGTNLIGPGFEDGKIGGKNIDGTVNANDPGSFQQYYAATYVLTGETYFSFRAGYSDSAESIDSYVLGSEFGSGSGINQLTLGTSARASVWDNTNKKFVTTYSRQFTNAYGSSQTIREIGLFMSAMYGTGSQTLNLVLRDVLASPITLTSGQSVILSYQLEATVA